MVRPAEPLEISRTRLVVACEGVLFAFLRTPVDSVVVPLQIGLSTSPSSTPRKLAKVPLSLRAPSSRRAVLWSTYTSLGKRMVNVLTWSSDEMPRETRSRKNIGPQAQFQAGLGHPEQPPLCHEPPNQCTT
jgi:hypothetical protein